MARKKAPSPPARISPEDVANLRRTIHDKLSHQIDLADEVVRGTRTWTPTQARVFGTLLGKVVPDLSASFTSRETQTTVNINNLSREELEALVAGTLSASPSDPPEHAPATAPDVPRVQMSHPASPTGSTHSAPSAGSTHSAGSTRSPDIEDAELSDDQAPSAPARPHPNAHDPRFLETHGPHRTSVEPTPLRAPRVGGFTLRDDDSR